MRLIGNILWLMLAGFWLAIAYAMAGVVSAIFIVTIPFSIQAFKLAGYALWPFGRVVIDRADRDIALSVIGNVVWFFVAGFWLALGHVVTGLLLMLTVIGIPMGFACLKMAGLAIAPFGKQVVTVEQARTLGAEVVADVPG